MNANCRAWVAALRSGEYKQGHHVYWENDCFCATGVAIDLFCKAHLIPKEKALMWPDDGLFKEHIWPWLGITDNLWVVVFIKNDKGKSFPQIADFIEAAMRHE